VTDLELWAGTPDEPLYRVSGSLRSDPFARIDAWGWYTLSAHLFRSLRRRIFLTPSVDRRRTRIYLFPSQNGGWNRHSRITFTIVPDAPFQAFTSWIGFSFGLHFGTFTILSLSLSLSLSLCSQCDLWPVRATRVSVKPGNLSYSFANWYFLQLEGTDFRTDGYVVSFDLPACASCLDDSDRSNFECFATVFFLFPMHRNCEFYESVIRIFRDWHSIETESNVSEYFWWSVIRLLLSTSASFTF